MIFADLKPKRSAADSVQLRVRSVRGGSSQQSPVLYWMSRDQRVKDNWALLFAQSEAIARGVPLAVCFCLAPGFLDASWRQYHFMIEGLKHVADDLEPLRVPFFLLWGEPGVEVSRLIRGNGIGLLVTDFDPVRLKQTWQNQILANTTAAVYQVDSRNIIPSWTASSKREYAAYTFRPKVLRLLPDYLEIPQAPKPHPHRWPTAVATARWNAAVRSVKADTAVAPVEGVAAGEKAARSQLRRFIKSRLSRYATERNDPTQRVQSGLSPYLHFGQISSLRVAIEILRSQAAHESQDDFLEELVTRRELSDNFCSYCPDYDNTKSFPDWALKSLNSHLSDPRPYLYSDHHLRDGETHDELWNAAQRDLVINGTMPGYLRMYWAKKILEWSETPQEAMARAVYWNDRYQLDGRDTNGYAGIAWSVGGVHDRAWGERPIFGKTRYMSYRGCLSKFDVRAYVQSIPTAPG